MIARLLILSLALTLGACSSNEPVNETHTGALETGDTQHPRDQSFYDAYSFKASEGWQIKVRMNSEAFDTFLQLRREGVDDNTFLQQHDDIAPGSNLNSELTVVAPASGTYIVWANSASAGETGAYTLEIQANAAQ